MKNKLLTLVLAIIMTFTFGISFSMNSSAADPSDITYQSLGTAAPPATLGGYDLFTCNDSYSNGQGVTSIPTILGDITLEDGFTAQTVPGGGWGTWSHGFTGRLYCRYTSTTQVVLTMPSGVKAFVFYVEPNMFGVFNISAQVNNGDTVTEAINGSASAQGFGFYSQGDASITSVTITAPSEASGFALGEIYVNRGIPAPPTAPVLSTTYNSVTAQAVIGCEYSLDNTNWTDSNTFSTNIEANKQYTVYVRYKETDTKLASSSSSAQITTPKAPQDAPAAPVLSTTYNSVTAQAVTGCEYSLDNTKWTDSNVFSTNIEANKQYTVYVRYKETDTKLASSSSSAQITIPVVSYTIVETPAGFENPSLVSITPSGNAFDQSVEVRFTYNEEVKTMVLNKIKEKYSNFPTNAAIFPLDISIYAKGTNTKVQPKDGESVEITIPIPTELLANKDKIMIACIIDGELKILPSTVKEINGVYCVVFTATHFSPYAFVVDQKGILTSKTTAVKTADTNNIMLFVGFFVLSLSVIIGSVIYNRRSLQN